MQASGGERGRDEGKESTCVANCLCPSQARAGSNTTCRPQPPCVHFYIESVELHAALITVKGQAKIGANTAEPESHHSLSDSLDKLLPILGSLRSGCYPPPAAMR